MNCIKGFFILALVAVFAALLTVYSGLIDVGATNPHSPFTRWLLNTTMERSVRVQAKGIETPPLDDPRMVKNGFRHYREMCVDCHLAPGVNSTEIRKGLLPEPPELQKTVPEWTPAELFWIVKNGVKMTGMPAWGVTHSNEKLWDIVAFLEKLPHMTAQEYDAMDKAAGPEQGEEGEAAGDHAHGGGTHGHDPDVGHQD
jgi:mono/diheme cytochrome c family protein